MGSSFPSDEMVLSAARALGRACLDMEKADRTKAPDVGEKTDEVIRLRNRLTQVARDWVAGESDERPEVRTEGSAKT